MSHYIIRTVRIAHCKRGPERCDQCRAMDAERIGLLELYPPGVGEMQRRVIQVGGDWREFDVVRVFEDEEEAWAYAGQHEIKDVEI